MKEKKLNSNGFTLIEIMIVLVILGILAAAAIPTLIGFVDYAQESLCKTQRSDIKRLFETQARMSAGLEINKFTEDNYGSLNKLCPSKSSYIGYSFYEDLNKAVGILYCKNKKHTPAADGRVYIQSLELLEKFNEKTTDEEKQKLLEISDTNFSNDTFRAKVLKEYGGQWDALPEDILNRTAYLKNVSESDKLLIQPYFTYNSQDPGKVNVVLFTNTASQGNWNTQLIFNHENGTWYEYIVKHPHNDTRENFKMTELPQNNSSAWDTLKAELKDETKWKAID